MFKKITWRLIVLAYLPSRLPRAPPPPDETAPTTFELLIVLAISPTETLPPKHQVA
ncbi:MAG: hypothetical protein GY832_33600 [Chloroflexi bacterium]|nr:hypothetical protein [Chloroflexota bacterium]